MLHKALQWLTVTVIYTIKFSLDGSVHIFKAHLIAKRFSQTYDIDYFKTVSSVTHLNSIHISFSLAINLEWPIFLLDIKNTFLYGDLHGEVDIE